MIEKKKDRYLRGEERKEALGIAVTQVLKCCVQVQQLMVTRLPAVRALVDITD